MIDDKWNYRFLELAEHISQWSKDPRTKVGAVIADDRKRVISMGFNGFPAGVNDDPCRYLDRETKHLFVAHAERNAIDSSPMSVVGCTLYTTHFPCNDCAKSIIQSGISELYTYRVLPESNYDISMLMFDEAGVRYNLLSKRG